MQITEDRQALHRIPELGRELPETTAYLKNSLSACKCTVSSPIPGGLCAFFDFGKADAIAFRSDEDALAVEEKTGLPFASERPGRMHACGHDGHMAILLELARRLSEKKSLPHNVLLVFQPAEETDGGAADMVRSGIFEKYNVKAIFGLHLWPELPAGEICSRRGEMMARTSEIRVDIKGKSAHLGRAREGIDALEAGTLFYSRIRAAERSIEDPHLLNFGLFRSGTVCNVISSDTHLEGSMRAYSDSVYDLLAAEVSRIAKAVSRETGCSFDISYTPGYPAVYNPEELFDRVHTAVPFTALAARTLIAEDFSHYQKHLPGLFFFLGTGNARPLHSDRFDFPEEILLKGADFFEKLAELF